MKKYVGFLLSGALIWSTVMVSGKAYAEDCFTRQGMDGEISQNIVQIFLKLENKNNPGNDNIDIGSGSVIRDRNGDLVILTARHVVAPRGYKVKKIGVLLSTGEYVGDAEVVDATVSGWHKDGAGRLFHSNDMAIAKMVSFKKDMESRFNRLPGLQVASQQPDGIMHGIFSIPAGIEPGVSGAPVLDSENHIIGVATRGNNDVQGIVEVTKDIKATDMYWDRADGHFKVKDIKVAFTMKNDGWMDPVIDPVITQHLGFKPKLADFDGNVTIGGYPQNVCVVYHGHVNVDR